MISTSQPCLSGDMRPLAQNRLKLALAVFLCAILVCGVAYPSLGKSNAAAAQETGLSRYKNRQLSRVDPADEGSRWKAYQSVGEVFSRLWLKPVSRTPMKRAEYATFESYPNLVLEDRDGDAKPEFFAYLPPDGSDRTQEFGTFFDLNQDGRTDWIVFYGGILFTKKVKQFLWHHHSIDTNGDGLFDIRIYCAIDMDGDGFPEENATAWVYDLDHDGLVDRAEHIVAGRITPIEPDDGVLHLRYLLNTEASQQPRIGGPMPTELFRKMAGDIDDLSSR